MMYPRLASLLYRALISIGVLEALVFHSPTISLSFLVFSDSVQVN